MGSASIPTPIWTILGNGTYEKARLIADAPRRAETDLERPMNTKMLRRPAVQDITGLSRSTIYYMMASGEFPKPIRIGRRAVAWRESDIADWLSGREALVA